MIRDFGFMISDCGFTAFASAKSEIRHHKSEINHVALFSGAVHALIPG